MDSGKEAPELVLHSGKKKKKKVEIVLTVSTKVTTRAMALIIASS